MSYQNLITFKKNYAETWLDKFEMKSFVEWNID